MFGLGVFFTTFSHLCIFTSVLPLHQMQRFDTLFTTHVLKFCFQNFPSPHQMTSKLKKTPISATYTNIPTLKTLKQEQIHFIVTVTSAPVKKLTNTIQHFCSTVTSLTLLYQNYAQSTAQCVNSPALLCKHLPACMQVKHFQRKANFLLYLIFCVVI